MGNASSTTTYLGKDPPRLAPPRPLRPPRVQHRHRVERTPSYARPENRVLPFGLPTQMPPLRHVHRHHSVPDLLDIIEDTEDYVLDKENSREVNLQRSNSSSAILSGSRPVIRHHRQDSAPLFNDDMYSKVPKRYRKKYQAPPPPSNTPNTLSRQSSIISHQKRQAPAPPPSAGPSPRKSLAATSVPVPPPPPPAILVKQEKRTGHAPYPSRSTSAPADGGSGRSNEMDRSALLGDIRKAAEQRNGRPPVIRPPVEKPKTPLEIFQEELSNAYSSREGRREKGELNVKAPDRTTIVNGREVTANLNCGAEKTEKSREVIKHEAQVISQFDWTPEQDLEGSLNDSLTVPSKHGNVFKSNGAPSSTPSKINKKNDNRAEKFGSLKRFKKSMQNVVGSIGRAASKLQGRKSVQSIFSSQEGFSVTTFNENNDAYKVTDDEGRVWKLTQIDIDSEASEKAKQSEEVATHYASNGEFIMTNGQLPNKDQLGASLRQKELDRLQRIEKELEELKARENKKQIEYSGYDDSHRFSNGHPPNMKPSRQMIPNKSIPPPVETYITSLPKSNQMNKWMRRHTTHFDDYDSEGEDMDEPYYDMRNSRQAAYRSPDRHSRSRPRQRRGITAYEEAQMHLQRPQHFREHRHHSNPLFHDTSDEEGTHTLPMVNKNQGRQVPKLLPKGSLDTSTSSTDTTPPLVERARKVDEGVSDYGEPDGQSSNGNSTPTSMDRKIMLDTNQCLDSPREKDTMEKDLKNPNIQVIQVPVEVHAVSSASALPNQNVIGITGMPMVSGLIPGVNTGLMYNPHLTSLHISNGHHQGMLQSQMATLNNGVFPTTMYPNGVLNTSIGAVPPPAPFAISSINMNGGIPPLVHHSGLLANQMPPHMLYGSQMTQPISSVGYVANTAGHTTNGPAFPESRPVVPGSGDSEVMPPVKTTIPDRLLSPGSLERVPSQVNTSPIKQEDESSFSSTASNKQDSESIGSNHFATTTTLGGSVAAVDISTGSTPMENRANVESPESTPTTFSEKAAALLKQVPSKSNIQNDQSLEPTFNTADGAPLSVSSKLPASKTNGAMPNFSLMAPQKFKPAHQQSACQPLTSVSTDGELITRF